MKSETFYLIEQSWKEAAQNKSPKNVFTESQLMHQVMGLFSAGSFFYTVFSPNELDVEFCSPSVKSCLGYTVEEIQTAFFWSCIHPNDLMGILAFEKEKSLFYKTLPTNKIAKYKIRYSFRMKNSAGKFIRILYQSLPIEVDSQGAVLRVLAAFTDINHLKKDEIMNLSYIGLMGESDFINVKEYSPNPIEKNPFSKREIEVLNLISRSFSNGEIADQLNISSVTVSNHRKKMLRKTKAGSTLNLVLRARDNGWI
ncbi:PAS domain-containing protein [Cryomorpha ignava]|uniref:PAS domain-containing protein n=1 Tax=Cryomorpha ignava TaxID=101383 RepID=A0A7K3WQ17_9FLAO|nr:LuxR C-terminal-related transcriptional regulator [Cryomorpha ignava]NEN23584.1 PAS domain-containing protein [Cryomorpha ignava]